MLIVSLYLLVRYILKIELWETSRLLFNKPENKISHDFLLVLYLLFDLVWMAMMVWLSGFVALKGEQPFISFGSWANELPFWLFPIFILMFLSKDYIRVWHGSSFKDFFLLNLTIIVGGLLSLAFFLILHADEDYFIIINKTLLFILFSTLGIVGIRIPLHLFRAWSIYNPKSDAVQRRNILIYGAGQHGGLYLRAHYLDYPSEIRESYIVGFIDDNPVLQNKYIFGLPVLAGLSNLEEVALKFHINEIILSTSISDDNFNVLRQLCLKLNIALLKWQAYTTPI
jgi:UDP-GlcNAc:undecaprenyl-phosphate GlcNAc-1-phosphate transferase